MPPGDHAERADDVRDRRGEAGHQVRQAELLDDLDHVDLLKQGTVLRIEPDLSARRIERQVPHGGDEL